MADLADCLFAGSINKSTSVRLSLTLTCKGTNLISDGNLGDLGCSLRRPLYTCGLADYYKMYQNWVTYEQGYAKLSYFCFQASFLLAIVCHALMRLCAPYAGLSKCPIFY